MSLIRRGTVIVFVLLGISAFGADVWAQGVVDTMRLALTPPDSVYLRRDGAEIVVGWYPPQAAVGAISGSRDFTSWYGPDPGVSPVNVTGIYTGNVDQTLKVGKVVFGKVGVDTIGPGGEASILMYAELRDRRDTYYREFNVGSGSYSPGTAIPITLIGQKTGDTLALGVNLTFGEGIVDSTRTGGPASFQIDLQTYEGFHIWRGLSPLPSHMIVISELSRDDAFMGIEEDSLYFKEWPKEDSQGRLYYEFVDRNAFVGFTYYYVVTCFDRGYFKGKAQYNKKDNFVCDEDPEHPATPGYPVRCEDAGRVITMTVDAGDAGLMGKIFAVPNPYRTGTSADTSPFYHNFPDGSIKFFHVPREADIKIFTVSGDLIWEAHHSNPTGEDGVVTWNVKNKHGQEVGSGVYLYRCESSGGSNMYGRIVVIR